MPLSFFPTHPFQPTLPARGATSLAITVFQALLHFNPRSPHGERPKAAARKAASAISTHAPRTGSDDWLPCTPEQGKDISTHAPRTGSDLSHVALLLRLYYFNPRSPHGERHAIIIVSGGVPNISTHAPRTGSDGVIRWLRNQPRIFQPTLPARGATFCPKFLYASFVFQPTLPARGATAYSPIFASVVSFQPTLPARGATDADHHRRLTATISTHAPRTGSDSKRSAPSTSTQKISTHAPRTGSDLLQLFAEFFFKFVFQPTLPARGATSRCPESAAVSVHFNPRSPHGERPRKMQHGNLAYRHFNPRSPHGERHP